MALNCLELCNNIKYFMSCRNMEKYHTRHGYSLLEWHLFPWRMLKLSRKLPQVPFQDLFLKLFGQNPMEKRWGFNQGTYVSLNQLAWILLHGGYSHLFILWIENTANPKAISLLLILRYVTGSTGISPKNLGNAASTFSAEKLEHITTGKTFHSTKFPVCKQHFKTWFGVLRSQS